MNKINLTTDLTNYRLQIDFLAGDDSTVIGTKYIQAPWGRTDATGSGWKFDNIREDEFNKEIFFSQIVLLNGVPIGVTTYATVTGLLLELNKEAFLSGGVEVAGDVSIKDAITGIKAKVLAGNSAATSDVALVVADANVKSDTADIKTAVQVIDDWDESDRAKVNPVAGQAGVAAGAGAVSANTQRTTLASDDPAVTALQILDDLLATAHNASDASNPVKIGGKAMIARPVAVANADRVNAYFDTYGRLAVVEGEIPMPVTHVLDSNGSRDGLVAYTSPSTITASGFLTTVADPDVYVVFIKYRAAAGTIWRTVYNCAGYSITASANIISVNVDTGGNAFAGFAAGDLYQVGVNYYPQTIDKTTDTQKVTIQNPEAYMCSQDPFVDTTSVIPSTYYYPDSNGMSMDGFSDLSLSGYISNPGGTVVVTLEVTNDEAPASTDWVQIYGYDPETDTVVNSFSFTAANNFAWVFNRLNFYSVRVKYVVATVTAETIIIKLRRKAL